jgi:hypothetical protein
MRLLLLLLALLAACPVAQAQFIPAATPVVLNPSAAALPAAPDTAAALHRLFALRRDKGSTGLKVGGTLLVVGSIAVISTAYGSGFQDFGIYASGLLGMAGSVPLLVSGIIRSVTYSKKHEQRTVQAWPQHRLSRHLKRALEEDSLLNAQARLAQADALAALGPATVIPVALDTAAALHRLFASKRRLFRVMVPLTIAVGAGFVPKLATQSPFYGRDGAVLLGATTLLLAAGELAILKRYSKKNEALAYQPHRARS